MAQAATYTYANAIKTNKGVVRTTGIRASISGGEGYTSPFAPDGASSQVAIETYTPAPGYYSYGFMTGGGRVEMYHRPATNVYQKCWWSWPWSGKDIGALPLTCKHYY